VSDDPHEDGDGASRAPGFDIDGPLSAEWMTGRTALVTGGGGRESGPGTVGWAVSRLLARHGARVAVLDRDPAAAERTVTQIERAGGVAVAVIADVTRDQECARAVSEARDALGSLDTLVNNVAAWSPAELFDVEPDRFSELLDLNLKTAWLMSRHAIPLLPPGGAIVNVASVAARRAGTIYGLGKAALEAMTAGAAYLLGERGIRTNAVELGALWTAGVADNLPAEAREPRRRMVALQTEGDCWDAAAAVLFLASDRARWISGQILSVDGGGSPRVAYPGVTRSPARAGDPVGSARSGGAGA
jgi:NAD(P)-dependent dehydrogenase (short-subunit alcohol dehydrogenase family)